MLPDALAMTEITMAYGGLGGAAKSVVCRVGLRSRAHSVPLVAKRWYHLHRVTTACHKFNLIIISISIDQYSFVETSRVQNSTRFRPIPSYTFYAS